MAEGGIEGKPEKAITTPRQELPEDEVPEWEQRLTLKQKYAIAEWVNMEDVDFHLLFKATKHGCDSKIFHDMCDMRGHTVSIAYTTKDRIFGFCTKEILQGSRDQWADDNDAFLFQLGNRDKEESIKYPMKDVRKAVFHNYQYGPTLGIGDKGSLMFFSGCCGIENNIINSNMLATDIEDKDLGTNCEDIGWDCTTLWDIEVYRISTPPAGNPWKRNPIWTPEYKNILRKYVINYKPPKDSGVSKSKILLLGQIASGKSSFYNTLHTALAQAQHYQADAGSGNTSHTKRYNVYEIPKETVKSRSSLKFQICDTMGIDPINGIGLQIDTLVQIINGTIEPGYEFKTSEESSTECSKIFPGQKNDIHVAVFVVNIAKISIINPESMEKLRKFTEELDRHDVRLLALATHVDVLSPDVEKDTSLLYTCEYVLKAVADLSAALGVPTNRIWPIRNYCKEDKPDNAIDVLALSAMKAVLDLADDVHTRRYKAEKQESSFFSGFLRRN